MSNERREDEKRRRDAAQAINAEVEPGGHEVAGRSIKQMVSVRLEAQLLKDLRQLAEAQGMSVSDLLRQAAVEQVERSRSVRFVVQYRPAESPFRMSPALTAGRQVTGGPETDEATPFQISGNGLRAS